MTNTTSLLKQYNYSPEYNALDAYDNTTYHITFSMLTDIAGSTSKIIIAESGVTELSIRSLIMNQSVGPNENEKNINLTTLRMSIYDPFSVDIYEKLQASAIQLNLQDYNNAVFLLEIKYIGYDSSNATPVSDIYGRSVIKCIITSITTQITVSGSIHEIELGEVNNIGSMDEYMILDRSIIVHPDSNTLGDILSSFASQLNNDIRSNWDGLDMITYQFKDEPYPVRNIKNGITSPFGLITSINDTVLTEAQRNPGEINTPRSSSIQDIIIQLLSNSNTALELLGNRNTSDNSFDGNSIYGIGHKIIVSVQYGSWSSLFNRYKKTITYKIVPFLHYNIFNSPENIENNATSDTLTIKKFQDICTYGELKKEYNYQYTGKNNEVLNFDIQTKMFYNFLFLPSMSAANPSYSNVTSKAGIPDLRTLLMKQKTTITNLKADNASLTEQIKLDPNNTELSSQLASNNSQISSLQEAINSTTSAIDNQDTITYNSKSQFMSSLNSTTYVDDLDVNTISNSYNIIKPSSLLTNMVNPITNSGYVENYKDTPQSIYSALLSQYWGSTTDALQTVNIEIKLDPYWIAGKNNKTDDTIISITEEDYGVQNYFKDGFCHFLLNFQIPKGVDDTTGMPILSTSDMYSGIYQVISVTSRFEEGKMIQVLNANRLCVLTLGRLLSGTSTNNIGSNNTSTPIANTVSDNTSSDSEWNTTNPNIQSNVATISGATQKSILQNITNLLL